ncbi:MAG: HEAT repeat domain-containing protein, partial [Gemmatimonadota bacterium]
RVVFLLRDRPGDKEAQKTTFRAFLVRVSDQPLKLVASEGRFLVDGQPIGADVAGGEALRRQLLAHGIGELSLPPSLTPPNLLSVVRALAAPIGTWPRLQALADHLTASGIQGAEIAPPVGATSAHPMAPSSPMGGQAPPPPAARVVSGPAVQDPDDVSPLGADAANEDTVGLLHFVTLENRTIGRLDELLLVLAQDPGSPQSADLLNEVVAFGEMASQKEEWGDLLRASAVLTRMEGAVQDESQRRLYHIALRRLVSRSTLEQIGRMVTQGDRRAEAITVLRRFGADATEVLINQLISAEDVGQRRGYFNAIAQMTEGDGVLIHMLGHDEWFVVRNVAELCGEMKLESAVPELTRRLGHSDDRVRKAVVMALGRIGSAGVVEPLQRALSDSSPQVRAQAAAGIEGPGFRNMVPLLLRALDSESHPEVQQEMLKALGRVGTKDAIDLLTRTAQPPRGLFRKKHTTGRVDAIDGLRLANTPATLATIRDLLNDKDDEVREAAEKALRSIPK